LPRLSIDLAQANQFLTPIGENDSSKCRLSRKTIHLSIPANTSRACAGRLNIAAAMEGPPGPPLAPPSYLLAISARAPGSRVGLRTFFGAALTFVGKATCPARQAPYESRSTELTDPTQKRPRSFLDRAIFGCLLKQQDYGKSRRMLSRSLFVFGLLLRFWLPAHASASTAAVMDSTGCAVSPPVLTHFQFPVAPPTPGPASNISMQCFATTTTAFQTLDFFFAAPPVPSDFASCTSTFFAICSITEAGGITDVHFAQGTNIGIPTDTVFNVELQGFTTGQLIDAVANAPEPDLAWTVGLSLVAAGVVNVWRRARLQSMRDRTA